MNGRAPEDVQGRAVRPGYWFVPKRFGYGATPVTWQGWLLTFGFAAALIALVRLAPSTAIRFGIGVPLVIGFVLLTLIKTDGAWRWRWGSGR